MGLLGGLFGGHKIKKIALTELGRNKSETLAGAEGARLKILEWLDEHGSASVIEISNGTGLSQEKVKVAANQMLREGWVTIAKGEAN